MIQKLYYVLQPLLKDGLPLLRHERQQHTVAANKREGDDGTTAGGDGRVVGPDQGGEDLPGKFGESEDVVRAHLLHDDSRENVSH